MARIACISLVALCLTGCSSFKLGAVLYCPATQGCELKTSK
jgi:hypothetical protein